MAGDTNIRKAVLASVIASVIVIILIQPALNLAWRFILSSGRALTDGIYANAALGHRNWVDYITYRFCVTSSLGFVLGILVFMYAKKIALATPEEVSKTVRGRVLRRILDLLSSRTLLTATFVIMVLSSYLTLTSIYYDLQLNTSFTQRLTVLAPRISDQEYKEFMASWASMTSRKDYEAIMKRMEDVAATHAVMLPKPLLK